MVSRRSRIFVNEAIFVYFVFVDRLAHHVADNCIIKQGVIGAGKGSEFVLFICHKCASRKNEQRHPTSHGSNSALYPFEPSLLLQWNRTDRTSYVRSCSGGSERKIAPFANYDIKLSFFIDSVNIPMQMQIYHRIPTHIRCFKGNVLSAGTYPYTSCRAHLPWLVRRTPKIRRTTPAICWQAYT